MKTGMLLCCLAAAGVVGCTTTHELWGESPEAVTENIKTLQSKTVDLTLSNGVVHEDVVFSFFGDSVAFRNEDSSTYTVVPFTSVVSVARPGSAVGPIAGFLGGLLVGGAIGSSAALKDAASATPRNVGDAVGIALTAPMAAAGGAIVGGLLGGVLGLTVGAVASSGDEYVLDPGPNSGVVAGKGERCMAATVTASGDTVRLGAAGLLRVTRETLTVRWHGGTFVLQRPRAEVIRRGSDILVIAPEEFWQ